MNKLTLKTTRDMVNEPILVHIMKYDKDINKLVNICGYEFSAVNSIDKIVELDLGSDENSKTGDNNVALIPYGAILRIECPKGSEPVFIEDMLSLDPNKNATIYAREFPGEISNVESVTKTDDGFKVVLKEALSGNLELYEISNKTTPTKVIQRLTLPTSAGSTIYTFTPTESINIASNIVSVRWTIADNSKPAGINISAIDLASAQRIEITDISFNNGLLEVSINNIDSNKPYTATEADVYFIGTDDSIAVLRGSVHNDAISGKGKIVFTEATTTKLNDIKNIGKANVVLIGEINNKVDYNYNITSFKSNTNGISIDTNDITFNDSGTKMTFLVKDEKNVIGSTINISAIDNEFIAGKLLYNTPTITRKVISGDNYWEVVVENIRTIPIDKLYKTHVEITYTEPNKLPQIVKDKKIVKPGSSGTTEESGVKPMTDVVVIFNDTTGNAEISMTGQYNIQPDQSYKIRDIELLNDDQVMYSHGKTENVTGTNDIKIVSKYSSSNGPIDLVSFRYSYANKVWSPIQDVECPNVYKEHITRLSDRIKNSKYKILENNLIIEDSPYIPMPTAVIVHKTVKDNTTNIESSTINIRNRSVAFKLGTFTASTDDEELSGFTIKFTYVYDNVHIEVAKEFKQAVENINVDKVKSTKWSISKPSEVWGEWLEPFASSSDPEMYNKNEYGKILKGILSKLPDIDKYFYDNSINPLILQNFEPLESNYPILNMKDDLPLDTDATNICWCAKFKISPSNDGYMFKHDVKDIKLKCTFSLLNTEKVVYIKFKTVKKLTDSVECIDPYLVNDSGIEVTMQDFNIYSDSIITGLPFISNSKTSTIENINKLDVYRRSQNSRGPRNINEFDFKYSRWSDHAQLFPYTLILADVSGIDFFSKYNTTDDGTITAPLNELRNAKYTLNITEVGITVTPEITFKNNQKVELETKVFKDIAQSKYENINNIIHHVGITSMNTVTPLFNRYVNERKTNTWSTNNENKFNERILPVFSNMTFKFSPDFKKLHFDQGIEFKYMTPMVLPWTDITKTYTRLKNKGNITHIKINYIGRAVANGKDILDLPENVLNDLNMFSFSDLNKRSTSINSYNNQPTNTLGINTNSTVQSGSRRMDMPLWNVNKVTTNANKHSLYNSENTAYPQLEFMTNTGINPGEVEQYQTGSTNHNIYTYPKILKYYYQMKKNIDNNRPVLTNTGLYIDHTPVHDSRYLNRDLLIYDKWIDLKLFTNQNYNSPNLIAKPITLLASYGIDDTMLTEYQKYFYKQVPHYIFTTTGNIDDSNNREIFNYRELKNDRYDYVIKYQVKFENEDEFNPNELVYYLTNDAIANSLVDVTGLTKEQTTLNNNDLANRLDLIKVVENRDLIYTTDRESSLWSGKDLETVNTIPYRNTRVSKPIEPYNTLNALIDSYIRTLVVYNDEFEAIYTDKSKSPFDVAKEYFKDHSDFNISPINYPVLYPDTKDYTSMPNLFALPELFSLHKVHISDRNTTDYNKLLLENSLYYDQYNWDDYKAYGQYRTASTYPVVGLTPYPINNIDSSKKIKIYAEIVVPPSRMYPSITTNKTLFEHNIIKLESKVIDLNELKSYGTNISIASLINIIKRSVGPTSNLIVIPAKISGLDEVRNYLYNILVTNEQERFYNKVGEDQIYAEVSNCTLRIKEIPNMSRVIGELVNVSSEKTIKSERVIFDTGRFYQTESNDFISDLASNNKNCTIVIEGRDTYREFKFNEITNDTTLLTNNDREFIKDNAITGITMIDATKMKVDLQRKTYIAESITKPDWIKMVINLYDKKYPIMFSKVISSEENRKYPLTSLYSYTMQLDPEWFERLKSSTDVTRDTLSYLANKLETALNSYQPGVDPQMETITTIGYTFSYNGVNVFDVYDTSIESHAIIKVNGFIDEKMVPLLREILTTLKAKGY